MKTTIKSLHKKQYNHHDLSKTEKFDFKLYTFLSVFFTIIVGSINWLIDPLWYSHGNILTGKNLAFNERITKTNLFLRTKEENYDCIIFGSSRVTALRVSQFTKNKCFNYAIKGGEIGDFIQYAQFLKEEGINPQKIYIGVDGFNFIKQDRPSRKPLDRKTIVTQSPYHAYLSADVFLFSVMTLLGLGPDASTYYDQNFESAEFKNPAVYKPSFDPPLPPQQCDLARVKKFADLRKFFPDASFIGYVPPRSAWGLVNYTYRRNLLDCYSSAFYQISQLYDDMYDFLLPSPVTKNPQNTYDGSHFSVKVNDRIAGILEGKTDTFGVRIDKYSYPEYRLLYTRKINEFLAENGEL